MPSHTAIIGFDLGHGETALTYLEDAMSTRGKTGIHPVPVFHPETQPTLYSEYKGEFYWGDTALKICSDESILKCFEVAFKDKPRHLDVSTKQLMRRYVDLVISDARNRNTLLGTDAIIWIGCPSGWNAGENGKCNDVEEYRELFTETSLGNVHVCKESRAAFSFHYNKDPDNFKLGSVENGVIVLDFGSSTIDATLAVGLKDDVIHPGVPYGASWLDKAILLWTIAHWDPKYCSKEELLKRLKNPAFVFASELSARKTKEEYYNNGGGKIYTNKRFHYHFEVFLDLFGLFTIDKDMMDSILSTPLKQIIAQLDSKYYHVVENDTESWVPETCEHNNFPILAFRPVPKETRDDIGDKSWLELNRDFLSLCHETLINSTKYKRGNSVKVVKTGGASRMPELSEMVADIFEGTGATIVPDSNPSLAVSSGLACWGRIEYQTNAFSEDVKKVLFDEDTGIGHIIENHMKEAEFEKIIGLKFGDLFADELNKWLAREQSGTIVQSNLKRRFKDWISNKEFKNEVAKESQKVQRGINKDINDAVAPLLKRYSIADIQFIEDLYFPDVMHAICNALGEGLTKAIGEIDALENLGDRPGFWGGLFSSAPGPDELQEYHEQISIGVMKCVVEFIYHDDDAAEAIIGSLYFGYHENIEKAIAATRYMIMGNN